MDQIVLNTSQLKKQKDTLNSRKNYYAGKISTFQGSKYNATSTLSSLLSKIRTNYTTIGTNIKNVSEYLEDYYKDAEGIEYKFNHSGGSIQTSSVNSIANEYYDVIEKYEFPTQDYFNLSFADSITSAVNNLFTFRKVVETDSVDFVMEDSLYNDVLDIYTEQIDMSIEEYEMIAKEIEKEIDSFSSLESLISMGAAVGAVSAADYNTQLKEALEKSGFSSLEEYKKYINELKSNLSMCEEAVRQLELSKITGKYDCLLFAEDFQNYSYQGEISEENIRKLSGTMNEYSPLSFDYDKVYEKYEDVSLMAYVATLSKMYDESTIKAYATDEVWNAYELLEASNISQVSAGSSDCLVGSNLVNAYNYLFENYGREEASQYLTDIEDRVNQILGQNEAMKKLANLSSKDDIFSAIGNEVYVAGTGVGDGLQSWWENMGHAFSAVFSFFTGDTEESRAMTKEEYEAQFFMQGLQQGNYSGPFLINNYEISQGIGNMLPSIIITRGLGAAGVAASTASTAGSAMIGVSSFGGSYHSSMVEGYSQEQALTYGLISGSSEALFEKFLGGVLSDVRVVDGKSYLYSMAKEATEEGLQNVFDAGVRNVLFGDVQTGDELVESTFKSMLYGGITAGILNSPSAISNSVKSAKVSHAIQNGSLDITNVVTSLKNSGIDIEFEGKTDTQIISENADIVYDMFKEKIKPVEVLDVLDDSSSGEEIETLSDENSNVEVLKIPRDNIQYGDNFVKKFFAPKLSKKVIKNLNKVVYWMDQKYGVNAGIKALKQLYNTGDSVCITRDHGCRNYIENSLSMNELKMYLDYVARNNFASNKHSSIEDMFEYFEHISPSYEQYGTDQAVIEELCYYELNGRRYSYREAREIINTAYKNKSFAPKFRKVGNQEYARLKTKLMDMGFDNYDASIILSSINDVGACSYASLCNNIFYQFRNSPDYFEQIFGYPMFIQKNGHQVLNSAELLLDLYLFANSIENNGNLISIKMKKVMADALSDVCDVFGRHILDARKQIYMHTLKGRSIEVIDAFLKSKDSHLQYGSMQLFNNQYGSRLDYNHFMDMLAELGKYIQLGCDVSMGYFYEPGSVDANTVIHMISCAPHLYDDMSTADWDEGGGHSVAVTGYNNEGFYVSSWGRKYLIPFRDLVNGGNFEIDVSHIRYNKN